MKDGLRSGIDLSPVAKDLLMAIDEYIKESSKKEYRFTEEEQYELERMIKVLNNQIDILVDYEIKRGK